MCSRPTAWLPCMSLAAIVAASGCGRPTVVAPSSDGLSAVEPTPHTAKAADKEADAPPFHFPDDVGGALLAKVLPPTDVKGPLNAPNAGPRRLPSSAGFDAPPSTLPPSLALPPRLSAERTRKPLAPHLTVDETLGLNRGDPEPPQPRSFVTGDRIRLPSVDANQPIPLPILAHPTADRAPLDDPTLEASAEAALAAPLPQRTKAVPYFRVTLPDPYDNRRPLSLPTPADDGTPRTGTIYPPMP
jgi:hypothetical protein